MKQHKPLAFLTKESLISMHLINKQLSFIFPVQVGGGDINSLFVFVDASWAIKRPYTPLTCV